MALLAPAVSCSSNLMIKSNSSPVSKALVALSAVVTRPWSSMAWIQRGRLAKDKLFVEQTYWFQGGLPRVPLIELLPGIEAVDVHLPRMLDRKFGTSITVDEAACLCAIARFLGSSKVLEIGTYDGNTAVALAANIGEKGEIVTLDLPPDFERNDGKSLAFYDREFFNLTPRERLGLQYKDHTTKTRIKQVYGDSATVDWRSFGGPFDLIFIDGCHSAAYVRSDSTNALANLAPEGVIVWHDYGMISDVSDEVDQIAKATPSLRFYAIEGTRLAIAMKNGKVRG